MDVNMFYGKRFENLDDAADFVGAEHMSDFEFAIIPPSPYCDTDEEEIDEGNLLRDEAVNDIPGQLELFVNSDSEDDIPLAVMRKNMLAPPSIKWRKRPLNMQMTSTNYYETAQIQMKSALESKTAVEVFETLFDQEVVELIVEQSKKYAMQKNQHDFHFNGEDLKIFVGILLFSGYLSMPRENMYWCLDEDVRNSYISNNMPRNRFHEIKRYLHLADNANLDVTDKMAKVRPLSNILCKKFCQFGYMHEKLSIDESMVKYFGGHSSKQFIRGNPVRFGFKNWMLTSSCGYLYNFDTYCGAKRDTNKKQKLPLGSKVVLDLIRNIPHPSDHILFFDNFFTSYDLLLILKEKGFRAIGTVRDNRTKRCPLKSSKMLEKQERGSLDVMYVSKYFNHMFMSVKNVYCNYRYADTGVLFVKWNDNSVVTVGTNFDGVNPLQTVKRWSRSQKSKVNVAQPHLIAEYNAGMGGVDLHDQAISTYNIKFRGKKWWWPLFASMINSCVVNAWKLYKSANNSKIDLLNFQRDIVRYYLRNYNVRSLQPKRSTTLSIAASAGNHFPKRLEKQRRCVICHNRIRWICELCNVTLCVEKECFKEFHTESR